jgi:hypothetical protein
MKRFSVKVCVSVTLLHIIGTFLLIDAGFAELRAMKQAMETGQPEASFLWLAVWAWIWQPVEMLVSYYIRHHPPAVTSDIFASGLSNGGLFFYFMLPWSVFVGVCFGFLIPRLSRWRHRTA